MVGGLKGIEAAQKNKWRRHFSAAEMKHYSRTKLVVAGLEWLVEQMSEEADKEMAKRKEEYADHQSVSILSKDMQASGSIPKRKARGRHIIYDV